MRIEGTLAKWNDDRGFGFITPSDGGGAVFVHLSAFPKDGRRPAVGERLSFEIEVDGRGRKRAKNLLCPGRPALSRRRQAAAGRRRGRAGLASRLVPLMLAAALVWYGYQAFPRPGSRQAAAVLPEQDGGGVDFRCDGRTHCSQMRSCAEATFFLRNCPGVLMDGNHDGVPCEQQWCTGPFAR